jgi:GTP-binding protein EngB required for normal cell division/exonuclease VII small subunit
MSKSLGPQDISQDGLVIALMGLTGAGKSTFINAATRQSGKTVGHKLKSYTADIRAVRYSRDEGSPSVVFVDTPGFDDTNKPDTEILRIIAEWLEKTYNKHKKLGGIIYVHRISDNRMAGTPLKNLRMFANLCGDGATKNVILVTTMWDLVDANEGQRRLTQLQERYWRGMLAGGSRVAHFDRTYESAWTIVVTIVKKDEGPSSRPPLLIQEEMVELDRRLGETQAGITLYNTLQKLLAEQQEKIRQIKDEAKTQDNPQVVKELNAQHEAIRKSINDTFEQAQRMKISHLRRFLAIFKSKKTRGHAIEIP